MDEPGREVVKLKKNDDENVSLHSVSADDYASICTTARHATAADVAALR